MDEEAALEALAILLFAPRQVLLGILDGHGDDWTPEVGSPAEAELSNVLFPVPDPSSLTEAERSAGRFPKARDNDFLVRHPRSVASLHVRVGADYLAGEGALLRSGESIFPPLALARVAFEHAVRAISLLDPWVDQRVRCARAMVEDIVSAHHERIAWKHLTDAKNEHYKAKYARYRSLKECAERCFEVDFSAGSPSNWTVDGEALRPALAVERWSAMLKEPMPAKGLYDLLSLYVHPQSFPSRREARFDESGETWMEPDLDQLRWASTWVIACWVDAARLLLGHYQGWWDVDDELDELVNATGAVAEFEA
jgi:hypothetical protein